MDRNSLNFVPLFLIENQASKIGTVPSLNIGTVRGWERVEGGRFPDHQNLATFNEMRILEGWLIIFAHYPQHTLGPLKTWAGSEFTAACMIVQLDAC